MKRCDLILTNPTNHVRHCVKCHAMTKLMCLLFQINVPTELEGSELMAEKVDRREFIDLLVHMLTLDQDRRVKPTDARAHPFITMSHLVEYAHCNL